MLLFQVQDLKNPVNFIIYLYNKSCLLVLVLGKIVEEKKNNEMTDLSKYHPVFCLFVLNENETCV